MRIRNMHNEVWGCAEILPGSVGAFAFLLFVAVIVII